MGRGFPGLAGPLGPWPRPWPCHRNVPGPCNAPGPATATSLAPATIMVPVQRHKSCPGTILVPVQCHKSCPGAILVPVQCHKSNPDPERSGFNFTNPAPERSSYLFNVTKATSSTGDLVTSEPHVTSNATSRILLQGHVVDRRPRNDRFPRNIQCNVPDPVTGPRRRQETS